MRTRYNLRFRVAVAFAAFGALVSCLMAVVLFLATHDLSQRLIDETLTAEMDDYIARRERNHNSLPPMTVTLHGYIQENTEADNLPVFLRSLPPGRHDVHAGELQYRVAVADRQGTRIFLLYDTSRHSIREMRFTVLIVSCIVIMILLSSMGGLWWTSAIIYPVIELVSRVRTRKPDDWSVAMADDFVQDELGELARAFDFHLLRQRAFMERERTFTTDISHELRTALTVIMLAAESLHEDDSLTERQKKRLLRIDRAARDMAELGTALLLMAREDNAITIEETCHLADVIEEEVEKHRYLLNNKSIQLEVRTDPQLAIVGERGLVTIAMANLIRNAFVYTQQGTIRIEQDHNSFRIHDTGQGIRSHQLESVFLHHFRDVSSKGAGIGLSLVKRISDRYGWQIHLESKEGFGTTVLITFFPN